MAASSRPSPPAPVCIDGHHGPLFSSDQVHEHLRACLDAWMDGIPLPTPQITHDQGVLGQLIPEHELVRLESVLQQRIIDRLQLTQRTHDPHFE